MESDWQNLQEKIKVTFQDLSLLQQAFRHASFVNENQSSSFPDNERLEFLGDAVMSFVIAEKIYNDFPELTEGDLTVLRTLLIREDTLAQIASDLNLGNFLQLGKGEESSGGRKRRTNLADTYEALVGAIYVDQGITITKDFIISTLYKHIEDFKVNGTGQNYKAKLQEFSQLAYKQLPYYHLLESSGPDHEKKFVVEVMIENKVVGIGSGRSKKAAEMDAARLACKALSLI